jgi:3-oxoacyl-[acyl-carrier protein] reductase
MLLQDKRVIVTGGITGCGKATVIGMVREGAAVVSMSRAGADSERAMLVMKAAAEQGAGPVRHIQCDISSKTQVDAAFDEAVEFLGGLDVLVNSAGIEHQGHTADLTAEEMLEQFNVGVLGTHFTNVALFNHCKDNGGCIINYSSAVGVFGLPMMAAYSAAKAGVIAYTRSIAKEWAPYKIRANIVLPAVESEMAAHWLSQMDAERRAEMEAWLVATIPYGGKLGKLEDAANLNIFLASDLASFIHGQMIGVDGGAFMGR